MTYPNPFPPTSEAAIALDALESGYHADLAVAVGLWNDPVNGCVTAEALYALVDEGLARFSTEGRYALLTAAGKALVGV